LHRVKQALETIFQIHANKYDIKKYVVMRVSDGMFCDANFLGTNHQNINLHGYEKNSQEFVTHLTAF
jgi:hypothetical protein